MKVALIFVCGSFLLGTIRGDDSQMKAFDEYIDDVAGSRGARDGGATITVQWTRCVSIVNVCVIRSRNVIGRIEEALLKLPMKIISIATIIPVSIAKMALSLANAAAEIIIEVKLMLERFFKSIYEKQARVLYGTVLEIQEVVTRIVTWSTTCIDTNGQQCTQLPHVGGYGPCGGQWPCTITVVCRRPVCVQNSQMLSLQGGTRPGQYGGQPGQYGGQPGQYGGQPGQYGRQPGQYGGQPGQYGKTTGQYGGQPGQYGSQPVQYGYRQEESGNQLTDLSSDVEKNSEDIDEFTD